LIGELDCTTALFESACSLGPAAGRAGELEDEPVEPVVSAYAVTGIAAITAPTPRATANAPTRPTELESRNMEWRR
jgi:hypothetical protein